MSNETSVEGLDNTLRDLSKIAEGADILKGLAEGVDTTGHTDEDGHTDGKLADQSDAGELDSMMIGKMRADLIAAGHDAGAIAAFMAGKFGGAPDDDEDDDDNGQPGGAPFGKFGRPASSEGSIAPNPRVRPTGGAGEGTRAEKSLSAFRGSENISKAMNVAPFLADFVGKTAEQFDEIEKSFGSQLGQLSKALVTMSRRDAHVTQVMAKSQLELGRMVKAQANVIAVLARRLGIVEQTPVPAKGAQNLTGARAMAKSIAGEAGGPGLDNGAAPQITTGEVVRVLSYCGLEKSNTRWGKIGGQSAAEISSLAEAGAALTKSHVQHAMSFLAANPAEAQTALTYR